MYTKPSPSVCGTNELRNIKAQAVELDRKIALTLASSNQGEGEKEKEKQSGQQQSVTGNASVRFSHSSSIKASTASNSSQPKTIPANEEKQAL